MMKTLIILFLSILALEGYSQKMKFNISFAGIDSKDSQYVFRVKLVNKGFDRYWVQDTTYLQENVATATNFIFAFLWRKVNGKFVDYTDQDKGHPLELSASHDSCSNCITMLKGDSLKFNVHLLQSFHLKKGQYRVQARLYPPLSICNGCDQLIELGSNYEYFTVGDEQINPRKNTLKKP